MPWIVGRKASHEFLDVSDEDDQSSATTISAAQYATAVCMADTNGCTAADSLKAVDDPTRCKSAPGPLIPTANFVNYFKSLKADPSMVVFANIGGIAVPGTSTPPSLTAIQDPLHPNDPTAQVPDPTGLLAVNDRYYQCKCPATETQYSPVTYVCTSSQGGSDLSQRYMDVAAGFGRSYGLSANICNDAGLEPALQSIADLIAPILTQVCLPRPLSAAGAQFDVYRYLDPNSASCQVVPAPAECTTPKKQVRDTATQQNDYQLLASTVGGCTTFAVVATDCNDPQGRCAGYGSNCLGTCGSAPSAECTANCTHATANCQAVCSCVDGCGATSDCVTKCNPDPENALRFTVPLEADERVEVVYDTTPFYGQTPCPGHAPRRGWPCWPPWRRSHPRLRWRSRLPRSLPPPRPRPWDRPRPRTCSTRSTSSSAPRPGRWTRSPSCRRGAPHRAPRSARRSTACSRRI